MAALNIFKKKPEEEPAAKKEAKKSKEGKGFNFSHILRFPHITEKATDLTKSNQYVFKVDPRANKIEIKKAIKNIYGVDAVSVRIINVLAKRRRLGKVTGWTRAYKKAIVRVKEGQKVEIMPR